MVLEKIFKREDGIQVRVRANVYITNRYLSSEKVAYDWSIQIKKPRGRIWLSPIDNESYRHRSLPFPDGRKQDIRDQQLKFVSKDELHQLYIELWESMKPKIEDI